jgi:hypothetical protein
MPYISITEQLNFAAITRAVRENRPMNAGELNYILTEVIIAYHTNPQNTAKGKPSYKIMNDIVGALDGAKVEFQRRIVNPYEAQKAMDVSMNGGDPYAR